MDIVYILKTMSLNFTQKDRVVALPCVVSDYTIAIKSNYPTDPRKKWEFPIYAVIDQRLTSVNWSWLCQKNNSTCLSNCKQWGELLTSWINWSATDFRQVIQLANWWLTDIKQPKWCRFFGRRIFFRHLFSPNEVFFCAKNIFSSHLATMATGSANPVFDDVCFFISKVLLSSSRLCDQIHGVCSKHLSKLTWIQRDSAGPRGFHRQSKKISNDQELIQSDPTSCPQN